MGKVPLISQGDLLLVPFPFSDQSGRKVRPVIVISNNAFNEYSEDLLVVGVTSQITRSKYTLSLTSDDLVEGSLITKCCIKVENILRMDNSLVIKKIGKIKLRKLDEIKTVLNSIL